MKANEMLFSLSGNKETQRRIFIIAEIDTADGKRKVYKIEKE